MTAVELRQARRGPSLFPAGAAWPAWPALAIFLLSLIAGAELVAGTAAVRALAPWAARLSGSVTVAVAGSGVESADAAAARAAEVLSRTPGIAGAQVLDPASGDAFAGRVLGVAPGGPGGAPPRLLAVGLAPGADADAARIQGALTAEGLNGAVDDHGAWSGPLERDATLAAASAAVLGLALLALAAGLAAWGVRAALARQRLRANLLIQLGAAEASLARPFRSGMILAATLAALLGAAAAAGGLAVLARSPQAASWLGAQGLPPPRLDALDLAAALAWPLAVAVVVAGSAGGAARRAVRRLS